MIGLYSVLWGKYREHKEKEAEEFLEPVKDIGNQNISMVEDIEANTTAQVYRENRMAVAISASMPHPPMLALEAPKA